VAAEVAVHRQVVLAVAVYKLRGPDIYNLALAAGRRERCHMHLEDLVAVAPTGRSQAADWEVGGRSNHARNHSNHSFAAGRAAAEHPQKDSHADISRAWEHAWTILEFEQVNHPRPS